MVGVDATRLGQLWAPRLTTVAVDMRGFIDSAVARILGELKEVLNVQFSVPDTATDDAPIISLVSGESS